MSAATALRQEAEWPAVVLSRVDPSRNMSRFWSVRLQPSLFEEVLLIRCWGRIGSRGQEKSYWYSTRQAALVAFDKIAATKRRRGYAERSPSPSGAPASRRRTFEEFHIKPAVEEEQDSSNA